MYRINLPLDLTNEIIKSIDFDLIDEVFGTDLEGQIDEYEAVAV
jgi:hypothetical protein